MKIRRVLAGLFAVSIVFAGAFSCGSSDSSSLKIKETSVELNSSSSSEAASETESKEATQEETTSITTETQTETQTQTEKQTEASTEPTTEATTEAPETYENNSYYDVVQRGSYNTLGMMYTIIDKVQAKKSGEVEATVIARAADGSVIGKTSDSIYLTSGHVNYFKYNFETDISNATFDITIKEKSGFGTGNENAVEMIDSNRQEDNLYLTLKQLKEDLGYFPKIKILFYKNDQIIDSEETYVDTCAENLDGVGSTDVAEIWVYDVDYDRFDFIYEP